MDIRKNISIAFLCFSVVVAAIGCDKSGGSSVTGKGTKTDVESGGGRPTADGGSNGRAAGTNGGQHSSSNDNGSGDGDVDGVDDGGDDGGDGADEGLKLPPIFLSEQHQATCLVKQGDTMPEIELQDVTGQQQKLSDLYGERLTVVCFWSSRAPSAIQQLQDMEPEIIKVFGGQGVKVATVNNGQTADEAKEAAASANANVPILLDQDGNAFAKVASRYLPRTYLLDGDGKIIWFDLEYSSDTRRHLIEAIQYSLAQP